MEIQQLFKSTKAFIFTKNDRTMTESDDQLYIEYINTLSPGSVSRILKAEIPKNLGRSEKFLNKSQILNILSQLGYLKNNENKLKIQKSSVLCKFEPSYSPLSVGHIFHKKGFSPYSPGVVRIKPLKVFQGKGGKSELGSEKGKNASEALKKNFRLMGKRQAVTPQPVKSERELKYETPRKSTVYIVKSTTANLSSSAQYARVKEPLSPQNLDEKSDYSESPNLLKKDGLGEISSKNGDKYKGHLVKGKKQGLGCYFHSKYNVKYKGEFADDLPNGSGKLKFSTGEYFKGLFSSGMLKDGYTTVRYQDQSIYEGELQNGKRKGSGRIEYIQGGIYIGLWENDQRTGQGTIIHSEFGYEGNFFSDSTEGPGVLIFREVFEDIKLKMNEKKIRYSKILKNKEDNVFNNPELSNYLRRFTSLDLDNQNSVYFVSIPNKLVECGKGVGDGKFVAGKLNGAGFACFGKFAKYIGAFKNGEFSGYGHLLYTDPLNYFPSLPEREGEYRGYFKDHKRHGHGQMTWPNSTQYIGNFCQDRRHNVQGTLSLKNGDFFAGTWVDNKMEGFFTITKKNGPKARVQFISSSLHPIAQLVYSDGKVYEGETQNLIPHGRGKMKWSSNRQYQGEFCDGNIDGIGRMIYENGDIYEGKWENGLRSGKGSFFSKSAQTKYEGEFSDNKKCGEGTLKSMNNEIIYSGYWNNDERLN